MASVGCFNDPKAAPMIVCKDAGITIVVMENVKAASEEFSPDKFSMTMNVTSCSKDETEKMLAAPLNPLPPCPTPQHVFDRYKQFAPEIAERVRESAERTRDNEARVIQKLRFEYAAKGHPRAVWRWEADS